MEKLNVCLINDSFPPAIDGVANAVTNYASIIHERYGSSFVVTPYYPEANDAAFPFPVLRYPSLDTTKLLGYRAGLPFSPQVLHRITELQPNILHSHCPITSTMFARALREQIDAPIVFTYHTKFDIDIANALRGDLVREEVLRVLVNNISACDEVWTVSRGAGENLRSLGYEGEYRIMPNGVDFPVGRVPEEAVRRETADCAIPEGVPVYLFVGRLMWYKGIRIILDALKLRMEAGADFRMVFIGSGGDSAEIMDYAGSLGLRGRVAFLGVIHDRERIRAWYCRADLFLFPSTFDTNGLVVREAAACALPSVLIAGSCAAEDVTDGRNGFLIAENAQSLAAKLAELPEEALRSAGARAQRELYLSWGDAVRNACERYEIVIDRYLSGGYPVHEKPSDEFYLAMSELMRRQAKSRERQRALRVELQRGMEELRAELQRSGEERRTGLQKGRGERWSEFLRSRDELRGDLLRSREELRSQIQRNWDEILADIRMNRELFQTELHESRDRLDDRLDEFFAWLDTFL